MESRTSDNQVGFIMPTGILIFSLLAVLVFLGVYQMEPPNVVGADAPATEFSAARAAQYLPTIAQNPRPIESAENTRVREYIASELTQQGLQPEIQTAEVSRTVRVISRETRQATQMELSGTINNVMARLEGTGGDNAIMIAGHYDSVERGPGASDDAAAVAAMLETIRALRAGPQLTNDVIFLFTDAEERGLLGAKAFAEQHPWAQDVKVALNFEARGTTGPSYMFETSDNNGWLISQFAQAAPYPVGYSFTYDIYQLLPNDTDLTMFRAANMAGFGFAFIDGFTHYHMPSDIIENLNQRSLQHHGSYMLSMARQLANANLDNVTAPNRTYFSILGFVIHYPQTLNLPLMILTAFVFLAVLVLGFRRGRLTARGLIGGFFFFLLVLIVTLLAVFAISFLPLLFAPPPINQLNGAPYNAHWFTISYISMALAIMSALYIWVRKRFWMNNLIVGAWLWWLLMLIVSTFLLPGTSYLFTWPLLLSLIALAVKFRSHDEDAIRPTLLMVLLPTISGLLLLTPLIRGLFVSLNLPLYVVVLLFVVLLCGLILPALMLMTTRNRWALPIVSALVGLNLMIFGALTAGVAA